MAKSVRVRDLDRLTDEQILDMRVRDIQLDLADSFLEPLIERLYEELDLKGIGLHPPCYLADEWLCPDRTPIIGIPFYLAHPRLRSIECKMMYEVEGGTEKSCMRLLRHECGHALNYAYEIYKRTRWRELFGSFSVTYSDSYDYQPYSRRYVIHLQDHYAQAHPDEDFAETFAVWLTPDSRWEEKYRDRPAIKKLRYIDGVMAKIGSQAPIKTVQKRPPWSAARMTSTLAVYYDRKRRVLGDEFRGFYDDSLQALFGAERTGGSQTKASRFLRQNRRRIVDSVTKWTGHRKYDIHQLVNRLITRCDMTGLSVDGDETEAIIGVTALLTSIASATLRVGRRDHRR